MNTVNKNSNPSMLDVAKIAGVSKTTVSYVLNNNPKVADATKTRVLKTCEAIGYSMNKNIQDFIRETVSGATRNIALVLAGMDFADPAYARLIDGIAEGTAENNYHLLFAKLSGEESGVMDLPPILRDKRVDGMLLSGRLNPWLMDCLRKLEIPAVVLGNYSHSITKDFSVVECNVPAGVHKVVEHLVQNGRSRIAYFAETLQHYSDNQHLTAFKDALIANGLSVDEHNIYIGKGELTGALPVMTPVFRQERLPFDALYCPDFRGAQEISYLVVGRSWANMENGLILATTRTFSYHKLPVPAVYMDVLVKEVAYKGVGTLLECIQEKTNDNPVSLLLAPDVSIGGVEWKSPD